MSLKTEPRSGIQYGDDQGNSNWNLWMDTDLTRIGRIGFHLSVKNSTTVTPPASPANGDTYIVGPAATGAWSGQVGNVAVWDATLAIPAWVFYAPRLGWTAFDESSNKLRAYYASAWSVGVAL